MRRSSVMILSQPHTITDWVFAIFSRRNWMMRSEYARRPQKRIQETCLPTLPLFRFTLLPDSEDEARATAKEVLRIDPKFSVETFARSFAHKEKEQNELFFGGLRKAGLN